MSEQTIYNQLRKLGMSPAGACGMLGNFWAESVLQSNNLQDSYAQAWGITDAEYTRRVNAGLPTHGNKTFVDDEAGYGLWQTTSKDRKAGLLSVCKQWGTVIEDEELQVWYACYELWTYYPALWAFLKTTKDYNTAADRLCDEWERPAVNNYSTRRRYAEQAYKRLVSTEQTNIPTDTPTESLDVETCLQGALWDILSALGIPPDANGGLAGALRKYADEVS